MSKIIFYKYVVNKDTFEKVTINIHPNICLTHLQKTCYMINRDLEKLYHACKIESPFYRCDLTILTSGTLHYYIDYNKRMLRAAYVFHERVMLLTV